MQTEVALYFPAGRANPLALAEPEDLQVLHGGHVSCPLPAATPVGAGRKSLGGCDVLLCLGICLLHLLHLWMVFVLLRMQRGFVGSQVDGEMGCSSHSVRFWAPCCVGQVRLDMHASAGVTYLA